MSETVRDTRPEIERIKERKDGLDVVHDLIRAAASGGFSALSHDDLTLAKWWGIYPQRPEEDGYLMMRVRMPNGVLTAEQLRAIGELSLKYGRGTGDITTRQCLQLHWLTVEDLPDIFDTLWDVGLTSVQACGDVWRNVVGCPLAGVTSDELFDSTPVVGELSRHFTGNRRFSNLPRKFKVSVTSCLHHCAQHEINDIGLVGVKHPEHGLGYDVWVGGGLGSSARMGRRLDVFIRPEETVEVLEEITALYRDNGNRLKRTRARSKFLLDEWGPERFRDALEERLGRSLPTSVEPAGSLSPMRDHIGVQPQSEPGVYALGATTKRGRFRGEQMLAVAAIAERRAQGRIRLTNRQNLILLDVPAAVLDETKAELDDAGLPVEASSFRRQTISCTGMEFCRLAVSETKTVAKGIIDHLEERLVDLEPAVRINVNGCPNACAQYQIADIGLQGALAKRGGEKVMGFQLHIGGRLGDGKRFGRRTAKPIAADEARFVLERVLSAYRDEKGATEPFSSWVDRQDDLRLEQLVGTAVQSAAPEYARPVTDTRHPIEEERPVLVQPAWLEEHLDDPSVVVFEVSEDASLYPASHIRGARALDWASVLADPDDRDRIVEGLSRQGLRPDHTVVLYGDRDNWLAAWAFWQLRLLGHEDVRLLDGGRRRWIGEGRPTSAETPALFDNVTYTPATDAGEASALRATTDEVLAALEDPNALLLDVRTLDEHLGCALAEAGYEAEEPARAGHIPGSAHLPWESLVREDSSLLVAVQLRKRLEDAGIRPRRQTIVYGRIGARAAHTWFVASELLGYEDVRLYDGSWTAYAAREDAPLGLPETLSGLEQDRQAPAASGD